MTGQSHEFQIAHSDHEVRDALARLEATLDVVLHIVDDLRTPWLVRVWKRLRKGNKSCRITQSN